jgi:S1-C subfamily serine protease
MKLPAILLLAYMSVTPLFIAAASVDFSSKVGNTPNSMVRIASRFPTDDKEMRCSGFVVDAARGLGLTVEHCIVHGQMRFTVDGVDSTIIKTSDWLVLFKVPVMQKPPLNIAKAQPRVGEPAWGFGWAFGKVFLQLERLVAGYDGTDLVLDGAFIEGMSGGPVVNAQGEVVGMIQGGVPGGAWLSGIEEIREFLK